IAGNIQHNGLGPDIYRTSGSNLTTNGRNILGNNNGTSGWGGEYPHVASSIISPTLADNGGPTMTHALVTASAAIDRGLNTDIPADIHDLDGDGNTTEPLPWDQRGPGFPRNGNGTVDSGAYGGAAEITVSQN